MICIRNIFFLLNRTQLFKKIFSKLLHAATRYVLEQMKYLDSFDGILHLKKSSFWRESVHASAERKVSLRHRFNSNSAFLFSEGRTK